MISAAVVGLGRIGARFERDPLRLGAATHAGAWSRHPGATLIAGVDPEATYREDFTADLGVPAYATWEEMLANHSPDMVSIATPPKDHARGITAAIEAGAVRVVCEKPFCGDLDSATQLRDALGEDSVRVGVDFTRAYDPLHRRLLGVASEQGVTGAIGHYTAGILNTASHWLCSLLKAGCVVEAVRAIEGIRGEDPSPHITLRLEGGGLVSLMAHEVADYLLFEMDIFTERSRIRLLDSGARGEWLEVVDSRMYLGYKELTPKKWAPPKGLSNPLLAVVDDAIRSAEGSRPMLCTVDDAIRVHAVIHAARLSLDTGAWVGVDGT